MPTVPEAPGALVKVAKLFTLPPIRIQLMQIAAFSLSMIRAMSLRIAYLANFNLSPAITPFKAVSLDSRRFFVDNFVGVGIADMYSNCVYAAAKIRNPNGIVQNLINRFYYARPDRVCSI